MFISDHQYLHVVCQSALLKHRNALKKRQQKSTRYASTSLTKKQKKKNTKIYQLFFLYLKK